MKIRHRARRIGVQPHHISTPSRSSSASATTQPSARFSRLPTGSRRATGSSPDTPSSTGLMAVPRLAPSTSAKAACGGTTPLDASDMTSSTTATEECAAQVSSAASSMSNTGCGDGAEHHPQACRVLERRDGAGQAGAAPSASARGRCETRPRTRVRVAPARRNSRTPIRISAGSDGGDAERQHLDDQRGADVSPQHHRQRGTSATDAAGGEPRHHQTWSRC